MEPELLADVLTNPDRASIVLATHVAEAIGPKDWVCGPRHGVAAILFDPDRLALANPRPEGFVVDGHTYPGRLTHGLGGNLSSQSRS